MQKFSRWCGIMGKPFQRGEDVVVESAFISALNFLFIAAGLTVISIATPYADLVLGSRLTGAHLSSVAFALLTLSIFLRFALVRLGVNWSWNDLLLAYSVWHFCSALPSSGFVGFLFPMIAVFRYFATPANQWEQLFGSFIPNWFALADESAARAFYHGVPAPSPLQWQPWLVPTLFWSLFATIYFAGIFFALPFGFTIAGLLKRNLLSRRCKSFRLSLKARQQFGCPRFGLEHRCRSWFTPSMPYRVISHICRQCRCSFFGGRFLLTSLLTFGKENELFSVSL